MTKSILFVGASGQLGGAEIMLLSVAQEYRQRCHVLLLADGPFRHRLIALGVSVDLLESDKNMLKVSKQGGRLQVFGVIPAVLLSAYRLAHAARSFDILFPNSQKAAVITMLASTILRKPVIWYLHDILSAEHFSRLHRTVVVTLANWTTRWVLTNSQTSADAYVACGGDKRRISVAPCGVDPAPFDEVSESEAMSLRRELKLDNARIVGLFGRITPWKGQHVLIQALKRLEGVHALIVGDALFGENDYYDAVVQLAKSSGVADRVHWLGFRQDIPRLMRAVNAILHTSVAAEPFGRVIVEGMLARRPVIAAADGASVEILGNGYKHLVKSGDPIALAVAVEKVLNEEPPERNALTDSNYARACSLFSPQRMIDEIDKALARAQ